MNCTYSMYLSSLYSCCVSSCNVMFARTQACSDLNLYETSVSFFAIGDIRYKIWYTFLEMGCVTVCFLIFKFISFYRFRI